MWEQRVLTDARKDKVTPVYTTSSVSSWSTRHFLPTAHPAHGGTQPRHAPGHSQRPAQRPETGRATSQPRRPRAHILAARGSLCLPASAREPDRHLTLPSALRKSQLLVLQASQEPDRTLTLPAAWLCPAAKISSLVSQTAQR